MQIITLKNVFPPVARVSTSIFTIEIVKQTGGRNADRGTTGTQAVIFVSQKASPASAVQLEHAPRVKYQNRQIHSTPVGSHLVCLT
jgi:hypothetical protein